MSGHSVMTLNERVAERLPRAVGTASAAYTRFLLFFRVSAVSGSPNVVVTVSSTPSYTLAHELQEGLHLGLQARGGSCGAGRR